MDKVFLETIHKQLIDVIKQRGPESLHQAVINGSLLGEYVVKKSLLSISPLASYKLDYLKYAHSDFSALIKGGDLSDKLKYEDMGVLLDRSKALQSLSEDVIDLIAKIRNYRNGIMHDPEYKYDILEAQARLIELFTKHNQLFKEYLFLEIDDATISVIQKVLREVEGKIANRLVNKIKRASEAFAKLSKDEKAKRISEGIEDTGAEDSIISGLKCPACKNKTLHYLFTVDVDWNPDGVIHTSSTWFECTACGLQMSEYDFDDLYDNPKEYTGKADPDPTWEKYYEYKDFTENAYEYM